MTTLLTGNLPLLAGAPNGIKKLRELILELAVRGKLVPQDPSDEPASELLKRIAEEKARLVGEGKAKKQKVLAEIGEEKTPFELPVGWVWCRLSELAVIRGGCTPSMSKSEFWDGGIPWVSPKDMHTGDVADSELKVTQLALVSSSLELVPVGSILLVGRSGILKRKLPVQLTTVPCTINQDLKAISPYQPLLPRYVQLMLMGTERLILVEDVKQGTTVQSIVYDRLFSRLFGLPPLPEQHRIVAKVDELMALCDRLEVRQADADSAHAQLVQALLGSLTQARDAEDFAQSWQRLAEHFHTLFNTESSIDALKKNLLQLAVIGKLVQQDPGDESASELLKRIAEEKAKLVSAGKIKRQKALAKIDAEESSLNLKNGWESVRFGQLIELISGQHLGPEEYFDSPENGAIPYLTGPAEFGNVHPQPTRFTNERRATSSRGDILLTVKGSGVGKTNFVDQKEIAISRQLMAIRPILLDTQYTRYLLLSMAEHFQGKSIGIAIPGISREDVLEAPIRLPPLAEQHRIVAKVDQLMTLCDQLKSRFSEARRVHEHLAAALIGQALNGEKKSGVEVVDFSAYLISKLAPRRTFGRVAHMKLLFLADSHLGLGLMDGYRRHAAGPLDTSIYRMEERAAQEGLYSASIEVLKSGQEKVSYHVGANISRSVEMAAAALGAGRKELDRLIALFEGRKTDDLEAVATLYAVWNDALAGGLHPNDEWLISEFRNNWHEAKERFTPDILGNWLGWMRDHGLVPTGNSAVTKSQAAFLFK
ncbi:restriction endonuclease subunit S [Xanthomonas campestris pv. trichodesmae]|uniref:Type I restriction endonuclease subunit S n=2 Tax=Xanthomonas citri TaxID=346 RepID=A0AB33CHK2_XANCI|nr:restriction endonuclease subunit S [Xanthomonas citri]ASK93222.1 type I restriction endonuclease subunit S [Xanthomonas citri pv. vignicola]MBV6780521.1 restriction endonuclease subunit S [Xanthomonas campestris pv. trichodesmae]MBZ3918933.1 type I restriction endonuclease subunit S [Xanthomonas campestris pv. trichodesmae]MBZ3924356.1 type I restriction endonuclease subunit S [Xanthomonas citri pv. sesbaniae]